MANDILQRWAPRYARFAIATAFLSAVAGRFGLWTGHLDWNAFERFSARTADLNGWAPPSLVPVLAWGATIAETTLAVTLLAGVGVRWAAFGAALLLAWFATAMLVYSGPKPPLDYSVYSVRPARCSSHCTSPARPRWYPATEETRANHEPSGMMRPPDASWPADRKPDPAVPPALLPRPRQRV